MKLRVVELLLVTTVPTMVLAEQGWPSLQLMAVTLIGGTLAAGGANAINMYIDRDIDKLMVRTQNRPLVTGALTPRAAMIFAIALEIVAFGVLWAGANLLAAVLAVSATLFYVFVYSLWLKRTSKQNIVIGGAAGDVGDGAVDRMQIKLADLDPAHAARNVVYPTVEDHRGLDSGIGRILDALQAAAAMTGNRNAGHVQMALQFAAR